MPDTAIIMVAYNEPLIAETTFKIWHAANVPIYVFFDGTRPEYANHLANYRVILASLKAPIFLLDAGTVRKGYARAMKDAMLWMNSYTNYSDILVTDSDDSYSPEHIKFIIEGTDTNVSGTRLRTHEAFWRKGYIKCEGIIMKLLFGIKMIDYTAVCRKIPLPWAAAVASKMQYSQKSFWLEFDARWHHLGYPSHKEIAVDYYPHTSKIYSPTKMPRIILSELKALLRTRWDFFREAWR